MFQPQSLARCVAVTLTRRRPGWRRGQLCAATAPPRWARPLATVATAAAAPADADTAASSVEQQQQQHHHHHHHHQQRDAESTDTLRARLIYQSRKRGTLENDLLLSTFAKQHLGAFSERQLREYDDLINRSTTNEWDIYYWCTGKLDAPDAVRSNSVFRLLVEHTRNTKREQRFHMPPL